MDATTQQQQQQKASCWTTDNLLADFVASRSKILLDTLKVHTPQIQDTSALSSILTQLMYFGANMGKIGFDLRYLVTSLFEQAVLRVVGGAFQRGAEEFVDSVGGEGKKQPDWQLPSQWMLGGMGRAPTTTTSPLTGRASGTDSATSAVGGGSTSMSPHTGLMDYPPLAYLTNAYLTALNSLRLLAPLSLAIPLREILIDSLIHVDLALEEYDRYIFGERASAFRSTLLARRHGSAAATTAAASTLATEIERNNGNKTGFKMQGMEGSAIQNEQKIMDDFMMEYKQAVQGYILKCFDEGIYGGLIHVDLDMDLGQDSIDTTTIEAQEQDQLEPEKQAQGGTEDGTEDATSTSAETTSTEHASKVIEQGSDAVDEKPSDLAPTLSSPSLPPQPST